MGTTLNIHAVCISAIVLLMASACNKPAEAPATQQAAATSGPATMPSSAVFKVNGHRITFDAPRATVDRHGGAARLLIYSDKDNGSGSFYFEVPIEGDGLRDGPVEWEMRTQQKERAETLVGIEAPDRTLQPVELAITAKRAGDGVVQIKLGGRFLVYAADSEDPKGEATVEAEFAAGVVDSAK